MMIVNLDTLTADQLMNFWSRFSRPGVTRAAICALFDLDVNGAKPKGYTRAAKDCANYAANKATAMRCRLRGDIDKALMYERIADRIYDDLPEYAQW